MVRNSQNKAAFFILFAAVSYFIQLGAQLMGYTNIYLGWVFLIMACAFAVYAFWIWPPTLNRIWKIIIIVLVGFIYFSLIIFTRNEPQKQLTPKDIADEVAKIPPRVIVPAVKTEKAKLQFSFWPLGSDYALIDTVRVPIENEIVTVEFTAKNISTAQANNGKLWIRICASCKFAEEPQNSLILHPDDKATRLISFGILDAGVHFNPIKLKIIPPPTGNDFIIAFYYACEKCPPVDDKHPQQLRVNLLKDEYLESYYRRLKKK
jgi:energy-coupling factor transporter transmembrane protein EcfT